MEVLFIILFARSFWATRTDVISKYQRPEYYNFLQRIIIIIITCAYIDGRLHSVKRWDAVGGVLFFK